MFCKNSFTTVNQTLGYSLECIRIEYHCFSLCICWSVLSSLATAYVLPDGCVCMTLLCALLCFCCVFCLYLIRMQRNCAVSLQSLSYSLEFAMAESYLSPVMRNPVLPYANNKGADQPAHQRSLISTFVVYFLDSIILLVSISKISRL